MKLKVCLGVIEIQYSVESADDGDDDPDYVPNTKKKLKSVVGKRLAVALDAENVSDYGAMHIISAVAQKLGHNITELALSRPTIQRARIKYRKEIATEVKQNFKVVNFDEML